MDTLLEADFAVVGKDRLYRCLDRIVEHKHFAIWRALSNATWYFVSWPSHS